MINLRYFIIVITSYALVISATPFNLSFNLPMNFVTACDNEHFPWLDQWNKYIVKQHVKKKLNFLIFDLSLTLQQKEFLQRLPNTKVIPIETAHPDILTKFVVRPNGRMARGWYTWKIVALKQALEHFDYFLYLDS